MMQQTESPVGNGREIPVRYDGKLKVTGQAKYAADFGAEGLLYAAMIESTIPSGEITAMDTTAADMASGVVRVITPFNAPKLPILPPQPPAVRRLSLLQDRNVYYNGEPIGIVIARTQAEAAHAASLVKVRYAPTPAKLSFEKRLGEARLPKSRNTPPPPKVIPADVWTKAAVVVEHTYTTPVHTHVPMEPHATIAKWDGEKLTVWDATQYIVGDRQTLAQHFSVPTDNVRVIDPYVGGGFGSKGSTWSHVILCALAAKVVAAPVRLALRRQQTFGPVGGRPATVQTIKLAADASGKLLAMQHDTIMPASRMEDFVERAGSATSMLYACENISISHKMVDTNIGVLTFQRAPGEAPGTTALESAMDELAVKLNMDPVELRLKNYAEKDPGNGREFTSKNLRKAYADAAKRFGWSTRSATPGTRTVGNVRIGYGMATGTYPANRGAAGAQIQLTADGRISIASATHDLGTGMYTLMAQTVMQELGVPWQMVDAKLGDSLFPKAPVAGGSQSTASVGPAVKDACKQLTLKLASLAVADPSSTFHGMPSQDIVCKDGKLQSKTNPAKSEPLTAAIARNGGKMIEEAGSAEPSDDVRQNLSAHSWSAVFAEVAVDVTTGMVQVRRIVSTYDIGKLLNRLTGTSQMYGGVIQGIGLALTEDTVIDPATGRIVNNNLAEYHVPANADAFSIEPEFTDIADTKFSPQGARGVGEIGITGVAAAIANAIYNATGKRIREFPITPDKILMAS